MQRIDFVKKISIMGDPFVGKSSLQRRYMGKGFSDNYIPTLGVNYTYNDIETGWGKVVRVSIMDMSGHRNFANLRKKYFRGTAGVLLVFDVTRPFDARMQILPWIKEIIEYTKENDIPISIIGNKIDLDFLRKMDFDSGLKLTNEMKVELSENFNIRYFETSAKTGLGVDAAFDWLASELVKKY